MKNRLTQSDEDIYDSDSSEEFSYADGCNSNRNNCETLSLVTKEHNEPTDAENLYSLSLMSNQNVGVANLPKNKTKEIESDSHVCILDHETLVTPLPQRTLTSTDNMVFSKHKNGIFTKHINYSETKCEDFNDSESDTITDGGSASDLTDEDSGDKIYDEIFENKTVIEREASNKPIIEDFVTKATDEEASDKASSEKASDKASSEEASDKASSEEASDKASSEEASDKASSEEASDKASSEEASDKASREEASDKASSEEASDKASSEEASDKASSEEASDKATSEEARNEGTNEELVAKTSFLVNADSPSIEESDSKITDKTTDGLLVANNTNVSSEIYKDENHAAINEIKEKSNTSTLSILPKIVIGKDIDDGIFTLEYFANKVAEIEGDENIYRYNRSIFEDKSTQKSKDCQILNVNEKAECEFFNETIETNFVALEQKFNDIIPIELKKDSFEMGDSYFSYKGSLDTIPLEFLYPCLPLSMYNV